MDVQGYETKIVEAESLLDITLINKHKHFVVWRARLVLGLQRCNFCPCASWQRNVVSFSLV